MNTMMADTSWTTLPSILIVEIFAYLNLADRLKASLVCKRWRSCLFHPSLWRKLTFQIRYGCRRRARFLGNRCGRFVKEALVTFDSQTAADVRECIRILEILGTNRNLQSFVLQPSSCLIEWPERDPVNPLDVILDNVENSVRTARQLRRFSLGCIGDLVDFADRFLPLLAQHQSVTLEALHIASVKEDPDAYGLIDFPKDCLSLFANLQELGIDYDYLTNDVLVSFMQPHHTKLRKLVFHVHGIEPEHETITNNTWRQLVSVNPNLEVTLNLVHSMDGAQCLLDILQPSLPLAHLRMFFCGYMNVAGVNFIRQHCYSKLRSVHIIDGMTNFCPSVYETDTDEDPFVMLAWKCPNLTHFTLIGYDISKEDVIAIARLRGTQLDTLAIPQCCISTVEEEGDHVMWWVSLGAVGADFNQEVSRSIGRSWAPIPDNELHPAVVDMHADAETAYLKLLLADQV